MPKVLLIYLSSPEVQNIPVFLTVHKLNLNCIYVLPPKSKTSSGFLFFSTVKISSRSSTLLSISSPLHCRQLKIIGCSNFAVFKKYPNDLQRSNLLVIHVDTFLWTRSRRKALFCDMKAKNSTFISKSYSDVSLLISSSKVKIIL